MDMLFLQKILTIVLISVCFTLLGCGNQDKSNTQETPDNRSKETVETTMTNERIDLLNELRTKNPASFREEYAQNIEDGVIVKGMTVLWLILMVFTKLVHVGFFG